MPKNRKLPLRTPWLLRIGVAAYLGTTILCPVPAAHAQSRAQLAPAPPDAPQPNVNQSVLPVGQSSVSSISSSVQLAPPYSTSVSAPDASGSSLTLTIDEAIRRGLMYNLGAIEAAQRDRAAHASVLNSESALLPNVTANFTENVERVNLAAEGFDASSLPSIGEYFPAALGPFHFYTAEVQVSHDAFDLVAIRNYLAAREQGQAAGFSYRDAHEQIVLAVAATYLQVLAQDARVSSAESQVKYAQTVYDQALQQRATGLKSTLEVNRSRVQLQIRQQQFIAQVGESRKQKMVLARLIGLSVDRDLILTGQLVPTSLPMPNLDELYQQAMERYDLQALKARVRAAEESRQAATAERMPSVHLNGYFGVEGGTLISGSSVYSGTGTVSVPIFNGGQTRSDIQQADANLQRERATLSAKQQDIRFEIRSAWIDEDTASKQLTVAEENRSLAEETVQQSIDRFKLGAADSVEVSQSEDDLSVAEQDYINSLYSLRLAQMSLARAVGTAEKDVPGILKGASR